MYCLDSDVCIELLRGHMPYTFELMQKMPPSDFAISAIAVGELLTGALKSSHPQKNRLLVERFLAPFKIMPFDGACATQYARLRRDLEHSGKKIGGNDMLIAATALANSAVLVTRNTREFKRVPHLQVENWEEVNLP